MNVHRLYFAYRAQMSLAGRFLLYFRQNWLSYTHELIVRPTAVYYPRPWLHMNPCCLFEILVHVEHKGALREGFGYGYWFAGTDCAICLCSSY
jgi:hypothetical protein